LFEEMVANFCFPVAMARARMWGLKGNRGRTASIQMEPTGQEGMYKERGEREGREVRGKNQIRVELKKKKSPGHPPLLSSACLPFTHRVFKDLKHIGVTTSGCPRVQLEDILQRECPPGGQS